MGYDGTPDGPKWTAQSEGVGEYERAPDGPKWTAQSTDEGEGGWRGVVQVLIVYFNSSRLYTLFHLSSSPLFFFGPE